MRLYQHSVRCPRTMQIFLDANPQYWRFIPMSSEEAQKPEQVFFQPYEMFDEVSWSRRSRHDTLQCVHNVPKPPRGYMFSKRQIDQQTEYFHQLLDKKMPNPDVDLYDATMVAVRKSFYYALSSVKCLSTRVL